ncbi:hypothetical protein EXIGLDRAFT_719764 [Exidia glandulosa HHB12029]|uniref:Uncharacterized protein n=1 Tax=Exidia glandulosa HHB12029 TaxID=1314781 RepID=A0A165GUR3_EXIGL|nr:hypothetical protein EXIGLDRAFT_719764 [Exidia glandulosa HHB12029]
MVECTASALESTAAAKEQRRSRSCAERVESITVYYAVQTILLIYLVVLTIVLCALRNPVSLPLAAWLIVLPFACLTLTYISRRPETQRETRIQLHRVMVSLGLVWFVSVLACDGVMIAVYLDKLCVAHNISLFIIGHDFAWMIYWFNALHYRPSKGAKQQMIPLELEDENGSQAWGLRAWTDDHVHLPKTKAAP